MKKVVFILALVLTYGVSVSNATPKVISVEKSKVTVVADNDNFSAAVEGEKDKKKEKKAAEAKKTTETKKACCGDKATVEEEGAAGCSEAQKKSCATAGKTCADEKAATKSCGGEKK